ncbi:hypothetical protein ACSSVZ_003728 [Amorphus sp. MBR-141]
MSRLADLGPARVEAPQSRTVAARPARPAIGLIEPEARCEATLDGQFTSSLAPGVPFPPLLPNSPRRV